MVTILIIAVFRSVVLIRGVMVIRKKRLLQCGYLQVWLLLEGGTYLRLSVIAGNTVKG